MGFMGHLWYNYGIMMAENFGFYGHSMSNKIFMAFYGLRNLIVHVHGVDVFLLCLYFCVTRESPCQQVI